ncbi:MAG: hypothetical protein WD766_10220 [Gemmatimonadota bacterium]
MKHPRAPLATANPVSPLVLALLALLSSFGSAPAQDPFGSVTNAPMPEEFIHWDAESFDEIRQALEEEIENGYRTWGTRFVFESVLPQAPYRHHDISIVHREGYTQPEIHETKWDLYVILDGSGTLLVGGNREGWVDGRQPEEQRPWLEGATAFEVTVGDVVNVPAKSWHQVVLEEGRKMTYMLINVGRNDAVR